MLSFDEVGAILDELADKLPDEFYNKLNGGIVLLPEAKVHPESVPPNYLYILGEYHNDPRGLGRYISIYYGSFIKTYGYAAPYIQWTELDRVLRHEFTHHIESLSGEKGLEIKDAIQMAEYKKRISKD